MEYLKLGKINKPHGLKGEVKIFSTTDFASLRYQPGHVVFLFDHNQYIPLTVHSFYKYKEYDVVSFENYLDVNKINNLLGKEIFVKKIDATLPNNHYHYVDLINLDVISDHKVIGKVISVLNMPANDILRCKNNEGKTFDIPFVKEFILNVDLTKKQITVQLIDGIL